MSRKPLTIEEINQMPMEALTFRDFERLRSEKLSYSNYKYSRISSRATKEEKARILALFCNNENDARWYWIWVHRGLNPDKAERKVLVDIAVNEKRIRRVKALISRHIHPLPEIIFVSSRRPYSSSSENSS
jgi:hypothetical protein